MLTLFLTDLRKKALWCYRNESRITLLKTMLTDGTAAMLIYRLMQLCHKWRLVPLEMFFNKLNAVFCGCIIGRGADFGPGFVLIHSMGVVINGKVRGGANILIEHQVTIGDDGYHSPLLGSDIFIGAGAKVFGGLRIGDGAKIGANAVVLEDVPPHATAVGVPARIVWTKEKPSSKVNESTVVDPRQHESNSARCSGTVPNPVV